jgi:hypothetical protein
VLHKPDEFVVDERDPWRGDVFRRAGSGKLLTRLIQSLSKSHVISVRGGWGTGKSVFLKRLQSHLEQERVPTIFIDAWKTDYLEDPLLAFVAAVDQRLQEYSKDHHESSGRVSSVISALAAHGSKLALPTTKLLAALVAPGGALVAQAGAEAIEKIGGHFLGLERDQRTAEEAFKEKLGETRDILTGRTPGDRIARQIVVIIDELDRCRPHYAVKLLERIKHFFSVQGVVFVIASDASNLPGAVATVYGQHTNGDNYLRKFIDFEYELPPPSPEEFIGELAHQFGLLELAGDTDSVGAEQAYDDATAGRYQDLLFRKQRGLDVHEVLRCFPVFAKGFGLAPRDQVQAFTALNAYLRTLEAKSLVLPQVLVFATCLRFSQPAIYRSLRIGELSFTEVMAHLRSLKEGPIPAFLQSQISFLIDVTLFTEALGEQDPIRYLSQQNLRNASSEDEFRRLQAVRRLYCRTKGRSGIRTYVPDALGLVHAFDVNHEAEPA